MRRCVVALLLSGVLATGASVHVAGASPDGGPAYPSEQDVRDALEAEDSAEGAVAALEAQLSGLAARADALHIRAAQAIEAFNGARVLLAEAEAAEQRARRDAESAAAEAERAHVELGHLAATSYSRGGELSTIGMLFDVDDGEALYDGLAVLRAVTASHAGAYQQAEEATARAETATRRADAALKEREDAAGRARAAREDAQAAVAEQQLALDAVEAERDAALGELAAARGTTVELEQQRQAGIAEEAAAERERRERERRPDPTPSSEPPSASTEPTVEPTTEPTATPSPERTTPPDTQPPAPTRTPVATPTPSRTPSPPPDPPDPPEPPTPSDPEPPALGADAAVDYAYDQLGKAYEWGADGPDTFDCSGLTMRAWEAGGVSLPHWSVAQARQTTRVSYTDLKPGDLIFWSDNGQASGVYHVGLYIGGGQMIHAPRAGKPVEIQSVFYWVEPAFYGRVR